METSINYPTSGLAVSRELVPSTSLTFIISLPLSFFQFNYEISSSGSIISLFVFQSSANVSFCLLQKRGHFSFLDCRLGRWTWSFRSKGPEISSGLLLIAQPLLFLPVE